MGGVCGHDPVEAVESWIRPPPRPGDSAPNGPVPGPRDWSGSVHPKEKERRGRGKRDKERKEKADAGAKARARAEAEEAGEAKRSSGGRRRIDRDKG